jgi:ribose 5-phosphate isomerase B
VALAVESGEAERGVLICGSGNGVNMTANKHKGIRSALCWNAEIATLARQHNNANILALPARFISEKEAEQCTDAFLTTDFEGGRHTERVRKIDI